MTVAAELMTKTPAPKSLLRRLLIGFMLVMLGIWLAALAHIVKQVKVDKVRQTAAVNRAWTRQIMLNMQSLPPDPAALARIGQRIEDLRLDMFREFGYPTQARIRVWLGPQLAYDSAPGTPLDDGWALWTERDAARGITVERREKPDSDWVFTPSAANYLLSPLVYSLPFMLLPAWLIVRVGLRPLRAMAQALEARELESRADLAPLPASPYRELAPVVDAVNRLMRRLSERLAREHEFLADAAHELKTPLSVVQINAHLMEAAADAAQKTEAGTGLREGVARATHAVHQLLAYERARQESTDAPPQDQDLAALLRERIAVAAPLALQRGIDIELRTPAPVVLPLHRESMAALLDNVVGNAIKYSPDGARVDVCLDGGPCITVTDQGPGIPPALRARVFERFYRVPGQDQAGSGLGLAIAERAAARNGARIALDGGPGGRGLSVRIAFGDAGCATPSP
jgi:two-component system sensor histidine kinase QseC